MMRRIALFRLVSGTEHVATEPTEKYSPDAVRISEYEDVEFRPVDEARVAEAMEQQRQASIAFHRAELAKLVNEPPTLVAVDPVGLAKRQAE